MSTGVNDALVVDGDVVDVEAVDALAAEFTTLDPDAQFDYANDVAGEFERQQFEAFGLTEALGDAAAVDESIDAAAQWMAGLGTELSDQVGSADLQPQGLRSAPSQAATPSIGLGLFGGLVVTLLGAEASVSSTNDGTTGKGTLATGVTIDATAGHVELSTKYSSTDSNGVTTTLETRNVSSPCPKADGTFEASATIDTSSTVNNGATGKRGTFDVTVKGTIDDDANLVGYDTTFRGQYADFANSRGGFIDVTGTRPASGASNIEATRGGGTITDEIVHNAVILGQMMSLLLEGKLVETAKKAWESGRCVALVPTVSSGPKGLAPSASVTIMAAPRSKVDGKPTGGKVTAQLTGGGASVSPSGTKVPADATFTYVAPNKKNETGEVLLESRSRRGVAKATINLDTKQSGYTASGGGGGISISGTVADVALPFSLQGVGTGFTAEFAFVPADATSGTLTYTGSGGGANMAGTGTYEISGDEPGPLTLAAETGGCVDIGRCKSNAATITLTPIAS